MLNFYKTTIFSNLRFIDENRNNSDTTVRNIRIHISNNLKQREKIQKYDLH